MSVEETCRITCCIFTRGANDTFTVILLNVTKITGSTDASHHMVS